MEKIVRPRLLGLAENPYTWRLNGLCLSWLAVLLMSPIPMTNPIPTIGILLLAVATLEADGLLMCVSYVFTVLTTLLFGLILFAVWQGSSMVSNIFQLFQ